MVAANRMTTAPPMTRAIKAGTDLLRAIPDKAADARLREPSATRASQPGGVLSRAYNPKPGKPHPAAPVLVNPIGTGVFFCKPSTYLALGFPQPHPTKRALRNSLLRKAFRVGATGFEPATF